MIISVINLKGGSGKTTTAMALATAAAPCRSPWTPPISAN